MTVRLVTAENDAGGPKPRRSAAWALGSWRQGRAVRILRRRAGTSRRDDAGGRRQRRHPILRMVRPGAAHPPPLPTPAAEPTLWARQPVTVTTGNVDNVTLALHPGLTASGKGIFDAAPGSPLPNLAGVASARSTGNPLRCRPYSPPLVRGRIGPDGHVTTMGVAPARYVLRATVTAGQGRWRRPAAGDFEPTPAGNPRDFRTSVDDVFPISARPPADAERRGTGCPWRCHPRLGRWSSSLPTCHRRGHHLSLNAADSSSAHPMASYFIAGLLPASTS